MLSPAPGPSTDGSYHQWVENKFEQYRDEIAILKERLEANEENLRKRDKEREHNLRLIDSLEDTVRRINSESKLILADHLELKSRYDDECAQRKEARQKWKEYQAAAVATAKDLEEAKASTTFFSNELQKLTSEHAKECETRIKIEKSLNDTQLRLAEAESSLRAETLDSAEFKRRAFEAEKRVALLEKDLGQSQREAEEARNREVEALGKALEDQRAANVNLSEEKKALETKLDAVLAKARLEELDIASQVFKLQQERRSLEEEKQALANELKGQVENSRVLCKKLAVDTETISEMAKERNSLKQELLVARAEIARLKCSPSQPESIHPSHVNHHTPPQSPEANLVNMRVEALEHQVAQLQAEKSLLDVELVRANRSLERQQIVHAQELEDARIKHERKLAEQLREASKKMQEVLFEEERKRLNEMKKTVREVETDPRLERVDELEKANVFLRSQLSDKDVFHLKELSEKERACQNLRAQFAATERARVESTLALDRERSARISAEDAFAETLRSRYAVITDYCFYLQNSESWLREVLQKVCLLSLQKLQSDFVSTALHRSEVLVLSKQLRDACDQSETLATALQSKDAEIEGLNESLQNEVEIGRIIAAKFTHRDKCTSPLRTTSVAPHRVAEGDQEFILSSRWDLVSELCKQSVRCEVAHEHAGSLLTQLEIERQRREVTTPWELLCLDFIELVQKICDSQSRITHLFLTGKEKALL